MTDKINRRDEMVQAARELFLKQGYAATSVRDIAAKVGCTEAALYYHFKDGKRGLFKAVIEGTLPRLLSIREACSGAESLSELITLYTRHLLGVITAESQRFRWVIAEFPNFDADQRTFFKQKYMVIYDTLLELILPFIPDADSARQSTWIIICTSIGYMQLFYTLDLKSFTQIQQPDLLDMLRYALRLEAAPAL
jgi:AcrR family transcriptional regulator